MKTSMQYAMEEAVSAKFAASVSDLSKLVNALTEAMRPFLEELGRFAQKVTEAFASVTSSRPRSRPASAGPADPRSRFASTRSASARPDAHGFAGPPGRRWRGRR